MGNRLKNFRDCKYEHSNLRKFKVNIHRLIQLHLRIQPCQESSIQKGHLHQEYYATSRITFDPKKVQNQNQTTDIVREEKIWREPYVAASNDENILDMEVGSDNADNVRNIDNNCACSCCNIGDFGICNFRLNFYKIDDCLDMVAALFGFMFFFMVGLLFLSWNNQFVHSYVSSNEYFEIVENEIIQSEKDSQRNSKLKDTSNRQKTFIGWIRSKKLEIKRYIKNLWENLHQKKPVGDKKRRSLQDNFRGSKTSSL